MNEILDLLTDYTFVMIALGSGLLGLLSGIMGVYVTVKKQGLICDAISHSTLPGVCIAFMVLGIKNLEFLLFGAFNVVPTPTLTGPIGIPTPIPIPVQDDKVKIIRTVKIIFFNLFKIFSFENNSVIITKLCNFNYNQHYFYYI